MSGNYVCYNKPLENEYNDIKSMEGLIDPETQKKSRHCRKYVIGSIFVIVSYAIVMCVVVISRKSDGKAALSKTVNRNVTAATRNKNEGTFEN